MCSGHLVPLNFVHYASGEYQSQTSKRDKRNTKPNKTSLRVACVLAIWFKEVCHTVLVNVLCMHTCNPHPDITTPPSSPPQHTHTLMAT